MENEVDTVSAPKETETGILSTSIPDVLTTGTESLVVPDVHSLGDEKAVLSDAQAAALDMLPQVSEEPRQVSLVDAGVAGIVDMADELLQPVLAVTSVFQKVKQEQPRHNSAPTSTVALRAARARQQHVRTLRPALARKAAVHRALRPTSTPTLRVLLIGNNYVGTRNELRGCVNDIRTAEAWLRAAATAAARPITVTLLSDERRSGGRIVAGQNGLGTGANILNAVSALVSAARAGDALYVHYSGHGAGLATRATDEPARIDSTWVPLDYDTWRGGGKAGFITDNELRTVLANRVPAGCSLWVTSDSCFSGTALDLRFNYTDASFKAVASDKEIVPVYSRAPPAPWTPTPPPNGRVPQMFDTLERATAVTVTENRAYATTAADVVLLSGCKDTQTSADTVEDGLAQGALTWALFNCIDAGADARVPLKYLVKDTRGLLQAHAYTQKPQLSSGRSLDVNTVTFAGFLKL